MEQDRLCGDCVMKDFLTLSDFSGEEIQEIVNLALELKKARGGRRTPLFNRRTPLSNRWTPLSDRLTPLAGKTAVLIFDKPSLRTKLTFQTAIYELGGNAVDMPSSNGRLGERESIYDIAKNLERWVHLLIVRTYDDNAVRELAKHTGIPVINALTDKYHPCQSIAFGLTVKEKFGDKKVKVAFVGDGNNVCVSHAKYCAKVGYEFVAITPKGYEPPATDIPEGILVTNNISKGIKDADVVYTDVWASMGQEGEIERRLKDFEGYRVDGKMMAKANSNYTSGSRSPAFSHCLPAHRGVEVTDEVLDGPNSIVFDEAENRLHAHKAIMLYMLDRARRSGNGVRRSDNIGGKIDGEQWKNKDWYSWA